MQLFFGASADGRVFPDFAGAGEAGALDSPLVGPAGLLEALETQLGLLGPATAKAVRIAAYLSKLRAAGEGRFWSASFAKDPWSTSATLLGWRDALVAGGWRGASVGAARLDDLAAAEAAGAPLPPGLADRAIALLPAIPARHGLRLTRLSVLEPIARLQPLWRRLVDALKESGVEVVETAAASAATDHSDLSRVQTALDGGPVQTMTGDGTFTLVEADTVLMAAEAVADWLAAGPPQDLAGAVVLAPDGDTALLDRALAARGLPALGLSNASPWRGALQILRLAFAVAWRPFDPRALLNLLVLPRPPIGRFAASRLARALVAEPGLEGRAWTEAWDAIAISLLERRAGEEPEAAASKVKQQVARWRTWTDGGQFARAEGMSANDTRQIAGRVAAWAMETNAGGDDRTLLALAAAAAAFAEAVDNLGQDRLPALLIERILAQALADGVANPEHVAEAGGLRAVRSPAALLAPVARLVWWNFVGPGERVASSPWSLAEQAALSAAGVRLETAPEAAHRISAGYADALRRATSHAILVRPALAAADQTVTHPLEHQLRPVLAGAADKVTWRAERLLSEAATSLAGRKLARLPIEVIAPPLGQAVWSVPEAARLRLAGRRESATSLGRLMNCQLLWFAQDVLGLRPGRFAEIPGPDQLFGNLAHAIANRLLPAGPPPALAGVRARAGELFEELLPRMAAPLQQPQLAGELAAARQMVPAALEALVRLLHDRKLEVVGAEIERQGAVGGLVLQGRMDLLVRRAARVAVLDMKWTHSERRYREEIGEGRAVQLAVYGALVANGEGAATPGGYFLLRQRRVLAQPGSLLADDPIEARRSEPEALQLVVNDWTAWRDLAEQGTVLAAGLPESALHRPVGLGFEASADPCKYCELTTLCRINVEAL